jgi:hypothetical protein
VRKRTPEGEWGYYVRKRISLTLGVGSFLLKPPAGIGSYPGTADLIGVVNGRGVALELKAPGGRYKVTPAQEQFLQRWRDAGGMGLVVASEEDLNSFLSNWRGQDGLF